MSLRLSSRALSIGRIFGAFIESHGDVGAEGDLHVHRMFGRKEMAAPVQMRPEPDAVIRHFPQRAQLKT